MFIIFAIDITSGNIIFTINLSEICKFYIGFGGTHNTTILI
jgi:hypothetical protein